jgi:hypothetical protein
MFVWKNSNPVQVLKSLMYNNTVRNFCSSTQKRLEDFSFKI